MASLTEKATVQIAAAGKVCYRCQAALEGDGRVCPVCGHRQYRLCCCGEQVPAELPKCPKCDATLPGEFHIRPRHRSHSHGSVRELLRSAMTGAITFAAICGLMYVAGGRVAERMGTEAPASVSVRLSYLAGAVATSACMLGDRLCSFASSQHLLQFLGLLAAGAVGGALWYLLRHARWLWIKLGLLKHHGHRRAG